MNTNLLSKNYLLTVVSATLFYIASFMMNTVCAKFVTDSGQSRSLAGVVAAVFTLASFFTRPLWGWLVDSRGRKIIYVSGGLLCLAGYGVLFLNTGTLMLFFSRIVSGAGYSALTSAGGTIVCDVAPKEKLQQAIAIYGVTNVLSQAIAPIAALWLYKYNFLYVVAVVIVIYILVPVTVKFVNYAETAIIDKNSNFCLYNKSALPAAYTIIFFAMATAAVNSFIPLFAQRRNLTADSWFFFVSALFLLIARIQNKKLTTAIGNKKVFYIGNIVYIIAFIVLVFCSSDMWMLISAVFYGFGAGLIHPIVNTAAVKNCNHSDRGSATSTFMMSQDLGMTLGAFLWGVVSGKFGFSAVYMTVVLLLLIMMVVFRKFLSDSL